MTSWKDFEADCAKKPRTQKCGIETLLAGLDPAGRKAVEAALANDGLGHSSIHKALKARVGDRTPNPFTIARHRRGDCQCAEGES